MINKTKYYIRESKLLKDRIMHIAQVVTKGTFTEGDLIRDIVKANTTLSTPDVAAMMELFNVILLSRLSEGYTVKTRFAVFKLAIKGTFDDENDQFQSPRNSIAARLYPGQELKAKLDGEVNVEKVSATKSRALMKTFHDFGTNTDNASATPDGNASIIGSDLLFDESDEKQGLFLKDEVNKTEVKISVYLEVTPHKILVRLPELVAGGKYILELRKSYNDGPLAKFEFGHDLTAA